MTKQIAKRREFIDQLNSQHLNEDCAVWCD